MKIKLGENLPAGLVGELRSLGHEVDTSMDEGLAGCPDHDVWQGAQDGGRFLVTQDLDFSDVRRYVPGQHYGLLLIRLRRPGRLALSRRIIELFRSEPASSWEGCFVVATETKVRVRRPHRGN